MSADVADRPAGSGFARVDLTRSVIGVFFEVYNELGRGFLESVYRQALQIALCDVGLLVEREVPVEVRFRGHLIAGFRLDLVVERCLVLELKAAEHIAVTHRDQLLNYLRATDYELGLVLNFGHRAEVRRVACSNHLKRAPSRFSAASATSASSATAVQARHS